MKDLLNQKIILYAGIVLVIVGIAGLARSDETATTDTAVTQTQGQSISQAPGVSVTSNDDGTVVSYQGVAGSTALDLLKSGAEVVTEDSNLGEFVVAINGVNQTETTYWLFYVNGAQSAVGASEYISQGGENIEWRLEN